MPPLSTMGLTDSADLWLRAGVKDSAEPWFSAPVTIACRFVEGEGEGSLQAGGSLSAQVATAMYIPIGSLLRKTGSSKVHQVSSEKSASDIKGRDRRWEYGCVRYEQEVGTGSG